MTLRSSTKERSLLKRCCLWRISYLVQLSIICLTNDNWLVDVRLTSLVQNTTKQTQQMMMHVNEELIQNHHPISLVHFSLASPCCYKTNIIQLLLHWMKKWFISSLQQLTSTTLQLTSRLLPPLWNKTLYNYNTRPWWDIPTVRKKTRNGTTAPLCHHSRCAVVRWWIVIIYCTPCESDNVRSTE